MADVVCVMYWLEREADTPKLKHYYHIRYAESEDGIHWKPNGMVCIDYQKDEYAIARPVVYREDGIYKMWYCYRGGVIRIGWLC